MTLALMDARNIPRLFETLKQAARRANNEAVIRSGQYGSDNSKFRGTYVTTILKHPVLAMKTGKKSLFEKFAFLGGTLAIRS